MILLLACANPADPEPTKAPLVPLAAPRLLRRISLELRGVVPSVDELDRVDADPDALDAVVEEYLADPRFEERVAVLLGERWHTRVDAFDIRHYEYDLDSDEEYAFEAAVGDEPLRLAAHVVATDAPWTDVVTADYTMANELLADIWPLDYPKGATGWQEARYTDGRPAVGALATNGLWWRYATSTFNQSRSRVAALSRIFTCYDILERPITFSATPSLLDADGTLSAIQTEDACVSCHSAIEPAAAAMFGFLPANQYSAQEMDTYHPEREPLGPQELEVSPAWYGTPISGLAELGPAIAADPRFGACAVQTFAEALWRREVTPDDDARLLELRATYEQDGTIKPLIREILAGDVFRVGGFSSSAGAATEEREHPARMLSPDQLSRALEDLTAFRWEAQGFVQMDNDERGYRVLAGGVNGTNVLRPQDLPGLTWAATIRRLAEGAASAAVARDLTGAGDVLLTVDLETAPGDAAFDAQLDALSWRLYAERASDEDRADWALLWTSVEATDGEEAAWVALLAAMFQDPAFVSE